MLSVENFSKARQRIVWSNRQMQPGADCTAFCTAPRRRYSCAQTLPPHQNLWEIRNPQASPQVYGFNESVLHYCMTNEYSTCLGLKEAFWSTAPYTRKWHIWKLTHQHVAFDWLWYIKVLCTTVHKSAHYTSYTNFSTCHARKALQFSCKGRIK